MKNKLIITTTTDPCDPELQTLSIQDYRGFHIVELPPMEKYIVDFFLKAFVPAFGKGYQLALDEVEQANDILKKFNMAGIQLPKAGR